MRAVIGYITQEGCIVSVNILAARLGAQYDKFLRKLTITHRPKIGPPKCIRLYKIKNRGDEDYVYLPRTISKILHPRIIEHIQVSLPPIRGIAECPLQCELFESQQLVVGRLMEVFSPNRIADGSACAILNLRAGLGKTFVAAAIISRLRLRTLYVVPKVPLAKQAVDDLRCCLYPENGAPPVVIGKYAKKPSSRNPSSDPAKQDVTVIVIDSALLQTPEFFAGYSLIIMDEVHTYCSEMRRKIFRTCGTWVMFGMSATTEDRRDGFDGVVHKELAYEDRKSVV